MRSVLLAAALSTVLVLTGCSAATNNSGSDSSSGSSSSATPTTPVVFIPGGTAEQNLPFFTSLVQKVVAADPKIDPADLAKKLSTSEFAAKSIQYDTARTAAGLAADSMFVAFQSGDKCLIAQFGPVIEGAKTMVAAPLKTGGCLVGTGILTLR